MNTDAKSYLSKTPERFLQDAANTNNNMYLHACLQQGQHFSPFLASVYGLMDVEAEAILKGISSRLATKWHQPYLRTCRYVKSRISVTLVRSTHQCIRGSRFPAHQINVRHPQWEDGENLRSVKDSRKSTQQEFWPWRPKSTKDKKWASAGSPSNAIDSNGHIMSYQRHSGRVGVHLPSLDDIVNKPIIIEK